MACADVGIRQGNRSGLGLGLPLRAYRRYTERAMPLTPEDEEFLQHIYDNLTERPLPPEDSRLVPLYEHLEDGDPIERLARKLKLAGVESRQLFSGFRGSGKSTELLRLKKKLEGRGYLVFYADAMDYINPALPIEISDLLVILAGAFSDSVEKDEGISLAGESYWERFKNFLTRSQVQLEELELGLFNDVAKLKLAIRDVPTFRQKLREALSIRLFEVELQVKKFFEDYVKALRDKHPGNAGIVFLFDNLEQLRGSLDTEREVIASVRQIFTIHLERLAIPYMHLVYTVPPWIKFLLGAANVEILHSIVQWKNDAGRTEERAGDACLLSVTERRFGPEGFKRFFGDSERALEFVKVCGGNVRDLIRLLREAVARATSLPVTDRTIQSTIRTIRDQFLPIPIEDAVWLAEIGESRQSGIRNSEPETIARMALFLDFHFVLFLRNGEDWYDVHPLIRKNVRQIAETEANRKQGNGA